MIKNIYKHFKKKPIEYLIGDATQPISDKTNIIVHICNDVGGWGMGFVLAISRKWKKPEEIYRKWYREKNLENSSDLKFIKLSKDDSSYKEFKLGNVQFVKIDENLWIANMIAQRGIGTKNGVKPIRYEYVSECLDRVRVFAEKIDASIHMPRIGCGLAGGEWSEIEKIVNNSLIAHKIETKVYDLK